MSTLITCPLGRTLALLPVLALLLLSACDSGGGDNEDGPPTGSVIGSASVTLEGAVTGAFTGSAVFMVDADDTFSLLLVNGAPTTTAGDDFVSVVFAGENGRPSGSVALGGEVGLYTLYTNVEDGDATVMVAADMGSVTFTTSSSDRLVGQFEFTGDALDGDLNDIGAVTISGSFDARSYTGTVL